MIMGLFLRLGMVWMWFGLFEEEVWKWMEFSGFRRIGDLNPIALIPCKKCVYISYNVMIQLLKYLLIYKCKETINGHKNYKSMAAAALLDFGGFAGFGGVVKLTFSSSSTELKCSF